MTEGVRSRYAFDGRVAVVTGGARGIGLACIRAFLEGGARVVLADRDEASMAAVVEKLAHPPDRLMTISLDVAQEASVQRGMDCIVERYGSIHSIVNNAGICTLSLAVDLQTGDWDRVLAVNLRGPWLCAKHGVKHMHDGGAIVNIASQAARRAQRFTAHYSASKMGVIGLTRALAVEFAPQVRVNAVSPGTIQSDMIQAEIDWRVEHGHDGEGDAVREDWLRRIPMGRFQPASAVANAVIWLCSDLAGETTGETINVSGGAVME